MAIFLDKLVLDKDGQEKKRGLSFHLLLESLKHIWRSRYQKLLVPLTIYSGLEQAFIAGDFTRVRSPQLSTIRTQYTSRRSVRNQLYMYVPLLMFKTSNRQGKRCMSFIIT